MEFLDAESDQWKMKMHALCWKRVMVAAAYNMWQLRNGGFLQMLNIISLFTFGFLNEAE